MNLSPAFPGHVQVVNGTGIGWKLNSASDSGVAQGFLSQFLAGNVQFCLTVQKDKFLNRQILHTQYLPITPQDGEVGGNSPL